MSSSFKDFRAFESLAAAESAIGELLQEEDIPYHIQTVKKEMSIYTGSADSLMNVWLQIRSEDFEKVNKLLERQANDSVMLDTNHFLNAMSDQELRDVLYRYDEWNADDYVMARKILQARGKSLTEGEIALMKNKRLEEIRISKKAEPMIVMLGYGLLVLGGFFSIMIGWSFYSATKTDPEGKTFYVYDKRSRQTGKKIMIVGVVAFLFYAGLLIYMKS